jgi:DNA-binding NarL/FixJ family response regulator
MPSTDEIQVLLVEDSTTARSALTSLLETLGHFKIVGTAAAETEVRVWLDVHPANWQLAIVDLVLRDGSGLSVVRRCKQRNPSCKIAVFSDYATLGVKEQCLSMGADAAFQKSDLTQFVRYLDQLRTG